MKSQPSLIISSNRLVYDIAIESCVSAEDIIRKLERTGVESAGTCSGFLA